MHLVAAVTGELPDVVQHDEPGVTSVLPSFTHLVLSPGPGTPHDAADFALGRAGLRARRAGARRVPGHAGPGHVVRREVGPVEPAHGEVAGVSHDGTGVFAGMPSPFKAVRYHSLAAVAVPDVLEVTACDGRRRW